MISIHNESLSRLQAIGDGAHVFQTAAAKSGDVLVANKSVETFMTGCAVNSGFVVTTNMTYYVALTLKLRRRNMKPGGAGSVAPPGLMKVVRKVAGTYVDERERTMRFELMTSCTPCRRATRLRHAPMPVHLTTDPAYPEHYRTASLRVR